MDAAARTLVDLEFDTGIKGAALLGDIASSLVSIDELLRDLASVAADPSSAEFRNIEIVAIEMRSPLKVRLSLHAISPDAVKAFQEICRGIILFRERPSRAAAQGGGVPEDVRARMTVQESQRLDAHILTLQNAAIPLRRVEVRSA
jgi:hypothetical protein